MITTKLELFLMVLLRDCLNFGTIEEIMENHVDKVSKAKANVTTNSDLADVAAYCKKLAVRLSGDLV